MLAQTVPLIVACLFAFTLGFAAHRASICTVRAAAEIISARTTFMLASIGKSALWVLALTIPFLWLVPQAVADVSAWQLTAFAFVGGLSFGFGAAINGACAYSTMTRLMDGEVRMAVSVGGFGLGVAAFLALVDLQWIARPHPASPLIGPIMDFALLVMLLLLAWALYELPSMWRKRPKHLRMKHMVLAPQYRLSAAALLIGLSSSVIFLLIGSPGYTLTLQSLVQGFLGTGLFPAAGRDLLLLAVLAGMLASTLQRGSFRLDWQPQWSWLRNALGGALMGLGTAMVPGGNDALILYGIPSLSPHAIPSYAALLAGALAGLLAMKHVGGIDTRVVCKDDIYLAEAQPPGSILNGHRPRGSA